MKNMEREKFEGAWKNAFDQAEISPSDKVWTNIELDLEKAKGGDLKRRLMFFQMLAAASVVFAITIGGIGYYYSFNKNDQNAGQSLANETHQFPEALQPAPGQTMTESGSTPLSSERSDPSGTHSDGSTTNDVTHDNNRINTVNEIALQEGVAGRDKNSGDDNRSLRENMTSAVINDEVTGAWPPLAAAGTETYANLPREIEERELPALYTPREIRLNFYEDKQEVDPVVAMLAKLEQREKEVQDGKEDQKDAGAENENLWTSVGFAAGSFNTVNPSTPSNAMPMKTSSYALAAPIVDQESKATGYSYSMGVNVGTRISERWVLQGGVNYLTHSSEYTADNVVMDDPRNFHSQRFLPSASNEVVHADEQELSSKIVHTAPYSVNNSMRYLSIPMQAGYLVVNKTFGVQLNAGVATDLFLQNTVEGEGDMLEKTSQPGGSGSPYRSVNLSGLLGTEFSYRFGPHYRVSLNPGIRYPFNTIYKSELGVQSTPLTFDVGLRFRYIFH